MKDNVLIWFECVYAGGHGSVASQLSKALCEHDLQPIVVCSDTTRKNCAHFDFGNAIFIELEGLIINPDDLSQKTIRGLRPDLDIEWRKNRKTKLLNALNEYKPRLIVTEMYPFSRGWFDDELVPLIETAATLQPRPMITSLCRDILLMEGAPAKGNGFKDFVKKNYDKVFIRGDSRIIRLDESTELVNGIEELISYQGYFADKSSFPRTVPKENGKVIVSSGSAWLKEHEKIFRCAIDIKDETDFKEREWKMFISNHCSESLFEDISNCAIKKGIETVRNSRLFRRELANSCFSISASGLTFYEVLTAGINSVVIPNENKKRKDMGQFSEQELRAIKFRGARFCEVVFQSELNKESLLQAVNRAGKMILPELSGGMLDGARNTAASISEMINSVL